VPFLSLILKNLGRNPLRTSLTCLAILVLVAAATLIGTAVSFLDGLTAEKATDLKMIVVERWHLPSRMPLSYRDYFDPDPGNTKSLWYQQGVPRRDWPQDFITWQFYRGTLDPTKKTRDNLIFFIAVDPDKLRTMMDDMEDLDEELVRRMKQTPPGALLGRQRLQAINKRVGERFRLTGMTYRGIDLEFEVVGELPEGRYSGAAFMNAEYLNRKLDTYRGPDGGRHPLFDKRLNLVMLKVRDKETYGRLAEQIERSPFLAQPAVKVETASSGAAAFLQPYLDLIRGIRYLLVPALLVSMTLVIANAIGISVRERRTEIAVLKVLGFRPAQVLSLVLGEALLVGGSSGLASAALTYGVVNGLVGGIQFPVPYLPAVRVPLQALAWGLALGLDTALLGSFLPAWHAGRLKVSNVFATVA
jgi:putative ABC transport system permease protein